MNQIWGSYQTAETHKSWSERTGHKLLDNIGPEDQIIWIKPGETILGHTMEFIGGRNSITTMMKARSSMGRNFIEVCKVRRSFDLSRCTIALIRFLESLANQFLAQCAGWGDVGYVNRWTMEITNNSRYYSIPLVVGRRIAQIVFFDTEGIEQKSYETTGKYQTRYAALPLNFPNLAIANTLCFQLQLGRAQDLLGAQSHASQDVPRSRSS